ncbi:MAG: diphthine synthase [Candidatus Altiarchaeota archaeon]|nr:diphthine synthase [Candidatus Altiarchaeota archaeon]
MLYLIGMGLEKGDMTLKGASALKNADTKYIENYTSFSYELDTSVETLPREKVESDFLIEQAVSKKVALLVPGDPLFATTHISLILGCKKKGVAFEVIHAPSIINALSRTGLSSYKFGRIVTLSKNFESDKERIEQNQKTGLHTVCLLDPEISVLDGLLVLEEMGIHTKLIVCERLGMAGEKIYFDTAKVLKTKKFGEKPLSIIVPSELHFFELEMLQQLSINP